MWPYQSVTRQHLEEKKDLVERLLQKLGAVPTGLGQPHPVSSYGEGVAEWAGREEDVQGNGMEDTDPFPWDMGEEDLLAELRVVLDAGWRRGEEG